MAYELKDYVEVADRIRAFHEETDGYCRITTQIVEFTDSRVVVRAEVYRSGDPNEPPAGTGHSFLSIPGSTPYTRGSELENAETSAVGRALVMAGIPAKNVASTDEVRGKRVDGSTAAANESDPAPAARTRTHEPGPSASSEGTGGSTGGDAHGEAAIVSEGTPAPSDYIDRSTAEVIAKAFGNKNVALKAARARFGETVLTLTSLTNAQAEQLYAERVGEA